MLWVLAQSGEGDIRWATGATRVAHPTRRPTSQESVGFRVGRHEREDPGQRSPRFRAPVLWRHHDVQAACQDRCRMPSTQRGHVLRPLRALDHAGRRRSGRPFRSKNDDQAGSDKQHQHCCREHPRAPFPPQRARSCKCLPQPLIIVAPRHPPRLYTPGQAPPRSGDQPRTGAHKGPRP